jgi:hypothetical protein
MRSTQAMAEKLATKLAKAVPGADGQLLLDEQVDHHHSIARILPAHPAPGPTIDFAYIAPYAHSIPKSPKRIARNLSNAHCAQYAKQPIARYMHFGQNNIARNAQNAYSAVYAFWPKSIARYMHFGQKRIARHLQNQPKTRHRRAICTCSCQLLC